MHIKTDMYDHHKLSSNSLQRQHSPAVQSRQPSRLPRRRGVLGKGQGQGQGPLKLLAALSLQLTLLTIYKVGSMLVMLLLAAVEQQQGCV